MLIESFLRVAGPDAFVVVVDPPRVDDLLVVTVLVADTPVGNRGARAA